ncbi:hypothetical protein GCM10007879_07070 [Maritalea porphyrae]|uniref:Probable membrane transporter protein n=2 Tax=Maritalea porphyrae TaxID=880732 RepID=A0ABQ5UMC6_9HYPH|nr:hypothetical protein GCM10007879_07070 [Maritalea porphyrae]
MGLANGVLTGMTGSYVVPGVMYLQSIDLSREELVQAMGILFTLSTLTLVIALGGTGLISPSNATTSFFALIPVILGMITGQKMRAYLKESSFRNATMLLLLSIGIYLIAGAFN